MSAADGTTRAAEGGALPPLVSPSPTRTSPPPPLAATGALSNRSAAVVSAPSAAPLCGGSCGGPRPRSQGAPLGSAISRAHAAHGLASSFSGTGRRLASIDARRRPATRSGSVPFPSSLFPSSLFPSPMTPPPYSSFACLSPPPTHRAPSPSQRPTTLCSIPARVQSAAAASSGLIHEVRAATRIEPFFALLQRVGRGHCARCCIGAFAAVQRAQRTAAAFVIQSAFRASQRRRGAPAAMAAVRRDVAATTIQRLWRGAAARDRVAAMLASKAHAALCGLRAAQLMEQRSLAAQEAIGAAVALRQEAYRERRRRERVLTTAEAVLIQRAARAFRCRRLLLAVLAKGGPLGVGLSLQQRHRRIAWLSSTGSFAEPAKRRGICERWGFGAGVNVKQPPFLLAADGGSTATADGGGAETDEEAATAAAQQRERERSFMAMLRRSNADAGGAANGVPNGSGGGGRRLSMSRSGVRSSSAMASSAHRVPVGYTPMPLRSDADAEAARAAVTRRVRQQSASRIQRQFRLAKASQRRAVGLEGFAFLTLLNEKATMIQRWYRSVAHRRRTFAKVALPRPAAAVPAMRRAVQRTEALAVRGAQRAALLATWRLATSEESLNPPPFSANRGLPAAEDGWGEVPPPATGIGV